MVRVCELSDNIQLCEDEDCRDLGGAPDVPRDHDQRPERHLLQKAPRLYLRVHPSNHLPVGAVRMDGHHDCGEVAPTLLAGLDLPE